MKNTIIGVDLAKHVIQACVVKNNKIISNEEIASHDFNAWLAKLKPATVVFEACGTSNYWKQVALDLGHDARLISAKLVSEIRQNQKTDKNDALAIAQSSQLADINFIQGKTFQQQELQSIMRMRELAVKHKIAIGNQLEALLLEFNIKVSPRAGGISGVIVSVLEDAENGFCMPFRQALDNTWRLYLQTVQDIKEKERLLEQVIRAHPECEKLLDLEGVSTINAVNLYISLGCGDIGIFQSGRDAAACIGLTPLQHSSGGKTKIGSIGKGMKNVSVRSYLVNGAMAVVQHVDKREPKTKKEQWIKQLLERKSKKCVAVALANKTVRTAFAMLTQGTNYHAEPLAA
ncbi:MAG: IS110 family transposase [Thiotrichaceae bacterium]|nr:IS110 family transposase [Thiotrichaceae bacterium]